MMSQPGQKPRGGGIYRSPFHYTPKDVACEYCQNYVREHPCRLCECTCLEERIEAGVLELNEFVRDCFAPSMGPQFRKRMDDHSAELLLPHVNLFAYGNEIIKYDNAALTSYGLLHREDYQPMQTPVQERFENVFRSYLQRWSRLSNRKPMSTCCFIRFLTRCCLLLQECLAVKYRMMMRPHSGHLNRYTALLYLTFVKSF